MYDNFTDGEIDSLKETFIENECYSDEYRETQPVNGLHRICCSGLLLTEAANIIRNHIDKIYHKIHLSQFEEMMNDLKNMKCEDPFFIQVLNWLNEIELDTYEGADSLAPILESVFDVYVSESEHPYGWSEEECRERL